MNFNDVAQLRLAKLTAGQTVSTVGYTTFNDGGQANYVVQTALEFNGVPNELSDITLANGNIAVLMFNGDAWNLKQFGAIGDDVADDTASLQALANKGGRMYMPRGVYVVTAQINFEKFSHVYGESAGVGLGGGSWPTLLDEAAEGATIIHPLVLGFSGSSVFNFENPDPDFNPLPGLSISNFKITTERDGAVAANLLRVINGYDSIFIKNLALTFVNKDFNALQLSHIQAVEFPSLGQTGLIENLVAIGEDDNTTTTPIVYINRMQEMQFIGMKVFGAAQSLSPATPRVPISVQDCRGLNFMGCSSAGTAGIGLDIYCEARDVDGIYVTGHTFEGCELGAWQIDGETRRLAAQSLTNVQIRGSRYQFPQTIAGFMKNCSYCVADATIRNVTLSDSAAQCTIYGNNIDTFQDNTGVGTNNVWIGNGISDTNTYGQNTAFTVIRDSAAVNLLATTVIGHQLKSSTNFSGDNFGLQITDIQTGSVMTMAANGQLSLTNTTSTYIGIVMADELGTLKRLRLKSDNTVEITSV